MTVVVRSSVDESGSRVADLLIGERFVTAIAIGFVVAVFALAQVVVLALGAFKRLW